MLVLTRRLEQIITLGDPLSPDDATEVQVIEVRGDQVRLGVKAPRGVPVHRKEIWLQVKQEESAAASGTESGQKPQNS